MVGLPSRTRPTRPVDDDARLAGYLSALQLADSAFPSGRYTLSHGLEAVAQSGQLPASEAPSALAGLLGDCLRHGVAPSDGVALACAHRASAPDGSVDLELVARADERLSAVKLAREGRDASARTGRALLDVALAAFGERGLRDYAGRVAAGRCPGNHAVVLGLLSAVLGVPRPDAVAGELYAFSAGWVSAAVRLALIDHRVAQGLLHRIGPVITEAALRVVDRDSAAISSSTPLLDVMSMRHEHAELRLFAT